MTCTEAIKMGRKQALLVVVIAIVLIELILLISETRGDFANGILFYIRRYLNPVALIVIVFFLGFYFIAGGIAAKEIILKNKHYLKVATLNAFATLFFYWLLIAIISVSAKGSFEDILSVADEGIRNVVAIFTGQLFMVIITTWIIIGYRVKNIKAKSN